MASVMLHSIEEINLTMVKIKAIADAARKAGLHF